MNQSPLPSRLLCGLAMLLLAGCQSLGAGQASGSLDLDAIGRSLARRLCAGHGVVTVEAVPNQYVPGVIDRIEKRQCAEGQATLYISREASDPSGLPVALTVGRPGAGLPAPIDIGQTAGAIIARLGEPTTKTSQALQYVVDDGASEVVFALQDGKVTSVGWRWELE